LWLINGGEAVPGPADVVGKVRVFIVVTGGVGVDGIEGGEIRDV